MLKDVMLDLETFSTQPNAAILQIGACFFNPRSEELGRKFYTNVSLTSSILAGLHVDEDTVAWWRTQSHQHLLENTQPLSAALHSFRKWWLEDHVLGTDQFLWSHGAAFDVPILDMSYRARGQKPPWHYQQVRDTRTLFAIAQDFGWRKSEEPPSHQALSDAVSQARQVQSAARVVYRP